MKYIFLVLLLLFACSTSERKIEYIPSVHNGCINIPEIKSRLNCIGKLVKQLEGIRNAKISVEVEELERIDSEFVNTKEIYCFTSPDGSEKFLCFETKVHKYNPTLLGKVYSFVTKFGFGFIVGIATGIGISN